MFYGCKLVDVWDFKVADGEGSAIFGGQDSTLVSASLSITGFLHCWCENGQRSSRVLNDTSPWLLISHTSIFLVTQ